MHEKRSTWTLRASGLLFYPKRLFANFKLVGLAHPKCLEAAELTYPLEMRYCWRDQFLAWFRTSSPFKQYGLFLGSLNTFQDIYHIYKKPTTKIHSLTYPFVYLLSMELNTGYLWHSRTLSTDVTRLWFLSLSFFLIPSFHIWPSLISLSLSSLLSIYIYTYISHQMILKEHNSHSSVYNSCESNMKLRGLCELVLLCGCLLAILVSCTLICRYSFKPTMCSVAQLHAINCKPVFFFICNWE